MTADPVRDELETMPDVNTKTFDLHQFLPYLMARVGSLMALSIAPHLERAGITLQMWRVLMVVRFSGPLTLIEVSRITGVKTSTLSRLVGRMAEKGLVSRERSQTDARTVRISIRRKGETVFRDLWPQASQLEELVTRPFAAEDVERLRELLREIETILARRVDEIGRTP